MNSLSRLTKWFSAVTDRPSTMYMIAPILLILAIGLYAIVHQSSDPTVILTDIIVRLVKEGTPLALLAIGAGLVLATGGVDISTSGAATLAGLLFAGLTQSYHPILCVMAGIAFGAVSGLAIGYGVHRHLPSLILSWAFGASWIILSLIIADSDIFQGNTSRVDLGFVVDSNFWELGGKGIELSFLLLAFIVLAIGFRGAPLKLTHREC